MEPIETAAIRNELRPLRLKNFPDHLIGPLGMGVRFRPGKTVVEEPGVQFVITLELQPRREEAFANEADLVLDLTFLPPRSRRAGDRLDEMVRAHLEKAAIVLTILADEDRFHSRLHVVVDAATAGAPEECERPLVGVKHHLLRLARIGAHEHHAAMAKADMRDLHDRRHAVQHDDFVAPVELVCFTRRERQRDKSARRRARVRLRPSTGVTPNGVVSTLIAKRSQLFENPDDKLSRSRAGASAFVANSRSSSSFHRPSFGRGCTWRSYENDVSSERRTFRTVLRESLRARAISLIDLP